MSEYVFRDAEGFGCCMDEQMDELPMTVREYFASENTDHYGTLHEEIVRCRDCIYYEKDPTPIDPGWPMMCADSGRDMLEPWGFCAWGKRNEEDK